MCWDAHQVYRLDLIMPCVSGMKIIEKHSDSTNFFRIWTCLGTAPSDRPLESLELLEPQGHSV